MDQEDLLGPQDPLVHQVQLAHPDHKGSLDLTEIEGHQVLLVRQEFKERLVQMDQLDRLEDLELLELRDQLVPLDQLDSLG